MGIAVYFTTTIINSTIINNHAPPQGGVFPYNPRGAGIGDYATLTLTHVTMSDGDNLGQFPQGFYIYASSIATVTNSIILDSCGGVTASPFTSGDYNITGGFCTASQPRPHDQIANPILGPLANNGDPTQTEAIGPGSPAIDAIPTGNPHCPATDQRGVLRPQGRGCDSGAYEYVPPPPRPVPPPRSGGLGNGTPPSPLPNPRPPIPTVMTLPNPVPPRR